MSPLWGTTLAALALGACYLYSPAIATKALSNIAKMTTTAVPMLIPGFIFAGLGMALIPKEIVAHWLGGESGWKGLILASILGAAVPGVTAVQFAIIVSLAKLGVGVGPLVAYFTAWALIGVNRLIQYEIPFLGSRLALMRFGASVAFPVLAGWLCQLLMGRYGGKLQ